MIYFFYLVCFQGLSMLGHVSVVFFVFVFLQVEYGVPGVGVLAFILLLSSALPGSVAWCLTLIHSHYCPKCFLLLSVFSLWYSPHTYLHLLYLSTSPWVFCSIFPVFFLFSLLEVSINISSNSEIFSSSLFSLLKSPLKAFFVPSTMF